MNKITRHWKMITMVLMALVIIFSCRSCINERSEKEDAIRIIGQKDTVLQVFWDNMGRQHSLLKERKMTLDVLQYAHDSEMAALRAEMGKKIKDLQSRTAVHTITRDTVITVVHDTVRPDGTEGKTFAFADEWTSINGALFDTSVALDYTFRTGMILDRMWKRPPGLFKRKELYLDITMTNPHTTLENVQTIVVKPDPKKWWETDAAKCGASFLAGYLARGK